MSDDDCNGEYSKCVDKSFVVPSSNKTAYAMITEQVGPMLDVYDKFCYCSPIAGRGQFCNQTTGFSDCGSSLGYGVRSVTNYLTSCRKGYLRRHVAVKNLLICLLGKTAKLTPEKAA